MATYVSTRRIVRQSASILISTPAVGAGSAVVYGSQVTVSLPNALYGVLVPRTVAAGAGGGGADARGLGIQAYSRHLSSYAANAQTQGQNSFLPALGGYASGGTFGVSWAAIGTTTDPYFSRRFIEFDNLGLLVGLLVWDQDRIQLGQLQNGFGSTGAMTYHFDLFEVY